MRIYLQARSSLPIASRSRPPALSRIRGIRFRRPSTLTAGEYRAILWMFDFLLYHAQKRGGGCGADLQFFHPR